MRAWYRSDESTIHDWSDESTIYDWSDESTMHDMSDESAVHDRSDESAMHDRSDEVDLLRGFFVSCVGRLTYRNHFSIICISVCPSDVYMRVT